jgi:hypothetical protein
MKISIYINTFDLDDRILESEFSKKIKDLMSAQKLASVKLYAHTGKIGDVRKIMEKTPVQGDLMLLLKLLSPTGLKSAFPPIEVNPRERSIEIEDPAKCRKELFANTESNYSCSYRFDSDINQHFCLVHFDYVSTPKTGVFFESGNIWQLICWAFVEAALPTYYSQEDLSNLLADRSFQEKFDKASNYDLGEHRCHEVNFTQLLPNHIFASYLKPDLQKTAHSGKKEDQIPLMYKLAGYFAFVNGWYENELLTRKNGRKVYQSIFEAPFYLALDTQHFDFEIHRKKDGTHQGSFSIPQGQFKAAKEHKLMV